MWAPTQYRRDTDMKQTAILPCFTGLSGRCGALAGDALLTVARTVTDQVILWEASASK